MRTCDECFNYSCPRMALAHQEECKLFVEGDASVITAGELKEINSVISLREILHLIRDIKSGKAEAVSRFDEDKTEIKITIRRY